jgi:hypothetical protein
VEAAARRPRPFQSRRVRVTQAGPVGLQVAGVGP